MKKIFLLAAAAISLAACNNDNYTDEPIAAQISATIGNGSRAADEAWATGDKIGITMGAKYYNMEYTTVDGKGNFTGTTMYFDNKKDDVTFTAYYPFTGKSGEIPAAVDASTTSQNQTTEMQATYDFLYATPVVTNGSKPHVAFSFAHMMSKITLIFVNGSGADVSKITSYSIEGLKLNGTFDTQTGTCAPKAGDTSAPIAITPAEVKNNVALPSLIVFPQTPGSVTLKLSDSDGQNYECTLNFAGGKLDSGNNYQFTVTVNKSGLTVNESKITNWNTKPSTANADPL